jgi:hypothetical protein
MKIQAVVGEHYENCTPAMCTFSPVLSVLLEAYQPEDTTPVLLFAIRSTIVLGHVFEYLRLLTSGRRVLSHRGLPQPLPSPELLDFLTTEETLFIEDVSPSDLVHLLHAANYLGISGLMELCCARIASACLRQGTFTLPHE